MIWLKSPRYFTETQGSNTKKRRLDSDDKDSSSKPDTNRDDVSYFK